MKIMSHVQVDLFPGVMDYWAPRKIASTRRTPQNCLRMIPLRSRSDSFTFTPGLSAIAGESNFSRCPLVLHLGDPRSDFAHGAPGNVSARLRLRLITGLDRSCNRLLAKSFPGEVLGH